jgi:hypothetical protein
MKRNVFAIATVAAALIAPTAESTHGAPLRETVSVVADQPIPTCRGSAWSATSSSIPLGRVRSRTVTPARLSSTPTSCRARSGARSMTRLPACTGSVRGGSRAPAPIIG